MASTSAPQQGNLPTEVISQIPSLDSTQVAQILRNLPGLINKPEGDAVQILSGLAQQQSGFHHIPQHQLGPFPGSDPGPSTHPRGPPNLNQIQVVPPPQGLPQNHVPGGQRRLRTPPAHRTPGSDGSPGDIGDNAGVDGDGMGPPSPHEAGPGGRTRGGRAAGMTNDEWARQRKDNHVSPGDIKLV
ncbi:hypothetical protein BDM02DRAFT_836933 [Thelephora ganbajun]|uniref:Uncharacterized protein n=1 Tax=Thelephora ganbajun TaxID=370292 RepID=A0ACB6Z5P6_THEGA|nr:hypothetical protein BDM02DRAFT_836933 [Thelephora ganbajun]